MMNKSDFSNVHDGSPAERLFFSLDRKTCPAELLWLEILTYYLQILGNHILQTEYNHMLTTWSVADFSAVKQKTWVKRQWTET